MTEFTASNGVMIAFELDREGRIYLVGSRPREVGERNFTDTYATASPEGITALREYFQHEATKKPWDDAKRGDVWLFWNEVDSQRALAWRGPDNWDAIDPRGSFHSRVDNVPAEMEAHSFYGWDKPNAKLIYRMEDAS